MSEFKTIFQMTGADEPEPDPLPNLPHMDFWVKMYLDEGSMDIEEFATPEACWWEWAGQDGWEYALIDRRKVEKVGHLEFDISYQDWALENGIAPDQLFLVRMESPTFHTDYYGETDCDFDIYVVDKEPLSEEEAAARWETYLAEQKVYREAEVKKSLEDREKQLTDFDAMYLQSFVYNGDRYWDDMSYPRGYRYLLLTDNHAQGFSNQLAAGEDNNGKHEVALSKLIEKAIVEVPGLTEERIRKMRRRNCW